LEEFYKTERVWGGKNSSSMIEKDFTKLKEYGVE
jgi:hypothetical protein